MAKLTVELDGRPAQIIRIEDVVTIGRDSNNDIQLIDAKVSRRHSIIERRKGYHVIRDLGSRNGTYLNGVQISESELASGDRIRIGEADIVFESEPFLDAVPGREISRDPADSSSMIRILDHSFELKNLVDVEITREGKQDLKNVLAKLTTLFEVGNIINVARDSKTLMNEILDQITRVIMADRCYLLLRDENSGEFVPAAVRTEETQNNIPKLSNTILNQVFENGISILSPDAFQDERFRGSESIFVHSIRSAMCVPLKCRNKILGVIHVDTKGSHDTFTESDLKLLTAIGISAGIAIENMRLFENLKRLFRSTVRTIVATIEASDPYTGGHSIRVAEFSKQLASCMGLHEDEVERLEMAALLHDVGKVGIPNEILNKPGQFDTSEINIMQLHPVTGADILVNIEGMEDIARIVRHHHERFDGTGYPDKLKGERIPLGSRILCIADTLDAITTDRAYRPKNSLDHALREIEGSSESQFDPDIVRVLKKCIASDNIRLTEP
ncbi:HD domain-containing protein [bacterium]|nr:HD domain-containing protein [candidate division CSSED10-310 bacterium]